MKQEHQDLIEQARLARKKSYSPYSGFRVGAAIRSPAGVHSGCNIENASYSLTLCAEASAVAAMIMAGGREILEIAVIGDGNEPCPPCGACRQRIREFAGPDAPVHMVGADGGQLTMTLDELLPQSFGPDRLGGERS